MFHNQYFCGVVCFMLCSFAVNAQPLQLCHDAAINPQFQPSIKVADKAVTGVHNVIAVATLKRLQQPFELHALPWFRCMNAVSKGEMDGAIGVGWTEQRAATMHFPQQADGKPDSTAALFLVDYYVYTHKDSKLDWNGQSFENVRYGIAAPQGFVVETMLAQLKVHRPIEVDFTQAMALTVNGRIDGYVQSELVAAQQLAKSKNAAQIQQLQPVFFRQPLYLVFSHRAMQRSPEQLRRIWQSLPAMQSKVSAASATAG